MSYFIYQLVLEKAQQIMIVNMKFNVDMMMKWYGFARYCLVWSTFYPKHIVLGKGFSIERSIANVYKYDNKVLILKLVQHLKV